MKITLCLVIAAVHTDRRNVSVFRLSFTVTLSLCCTAYIQNRSNLSTMYHTHTRATPVIFLVPSTP